MCCPSLQSPQTTFHEENINGPDLGDDDLLSALNDDMGDGFEGMSGFDNIFMSIVLPMDLSADRIFFVNKSAHLLKKLDLKMRQDDLLKKVPSC